MKLYYSPGACSLSDHIALHEAGLTFQCEKVDLRAKKTESGEDFTAINPKGYVPTIVLDDGSVLTENVALLDWIADQAPKLRPDGPLGRTRLLETLAYISTEVHKGFKPFFVPGSSDEDKAKAGHMISKRLELLAKQIGDGDYLFGSEFSAADAYLFTMLLWAKKNGVVTPDPLPAYFDRVRQRPQVAKALTHEGLA